MAPSSFLTRFTNMKGSQAASDPNSRHARMASANSASSSSASRTSLDQPVGPASPPRPIATPKVPPKLMLTTESGLEGDSIHAPSTPNSHSQRPPSVLLDETLDMTMSPDETRSSEEQQKRVTGGRRGSPAGLDLAGAQSGSISNDEHTVTPKPSRAMEGSASVKEGNGKKNEVPLKVDSSLGKQLSKNPSTTSLNGKAHPQYANIIVSSPPPGPDTSFSRTNTHGGLSVPSDGEGGISDSASIISASGKKKKKLWRKSSTSSFLGSKSKDGGSGGSALGAALAASGMGLANSSGVMTTSRHSAVSPERLRQDTMRIASPPKQPEHARPSFRSRRESEDSSGLYDSDDAMSLNDHDIPITGFAVASSKRNNDFHEVFPDIPDDDYLIEDYGCALQKEILVQGRLYISENHMAFHANIFGWVTNFTIPFTSVTGLEKRMTAFVIPNAIQISTTDSKYLFASFLSRDTTFDVISNIWRLARPPGLNNASFSDVGSTSALDAGSIGTANGNGHVPNGTANGNATDIGSAGKKAGHKATTCSCSKNKGHYPDTTMDTTLPGTPEKIYNLMITSGFIKEFMSDNQKLTSIQISDWAPLAEGSNLLARNMSYIKPLNGPVGPKQTKCELRDETVHVDFDDWVTTLTTTRTPDVPSGGSFAIKTRTCITWAGPTSSRVVITSAVEWSGRSFLKSIIDRSCLDGQRTYSAELERAMRSYINEHRTEFLPEGVDAAEADTVAAAAEASAAEATAGDISRDGTTEPRRVEDVERRGLQWALDTFNSAMSLTSQSFGALMDILGELWDMGGTVAGPRAWWGVLIFGLVLMNFWTWSSLSQSRAREKLTRDTFAKMAGTGYPPSRHHSSGAHGSELGHAEREKLAVVATEAVKVFWEGVVDRQEEKWRREIQDEVKALRELVMRLEADLLPREAEGKLMADVD
ncbi:hypothetical protein FRB93_003051 [Tulasnella sp. JGI-2019a]|nr:hypothetical protein FRB93_003051 [Tulasnella sp. JGI-2019a]